MTDFPHLDRDGVPASPDIVTELRNGTEGAGWSCDFASEFALIEEAADEIEQLRADAEDTRQILMGWTSVWVEAGAPLGDGTVLTERVRAEIARLRTDLAEAYDACRYALADSPGWQALAETVVATWEARRD